MTVILLGLDGLSGDDLTSVMRRVQLPNFRKVVERGRAAPLRSVYPYVTAPAWTSIFSGVNPGKHGIFEMFQIRGNERPPSNMRTSDIPFLWDYASWAGKRALVMGVPFVYPAPEINGKFVTGRFVPALSSYPSRMPRDVDLAGYSYDDLDTEEKIEGIMAEGPRTHSRRQLIELTKRMDASLAMIDSERWDLVVLVDNLPDEVFHFSYDDDRVIEEMFVLLDKWLGGLLQRMKEEDTLLIVSDHGFKKVEKVLFINEWLAAKGYLNIKRSLLSRIMGAAGLDWDVLGKSGSVASAYVFLLNRFPGVLKFLKRLLRGSLVMDQGKQTSEASVVAFNINEPVAWLKICSKNPEEFASRYDRLERDLAELKKSGLLKSWFPTKAIYDGKYVGQAPGQLIVEAPDGWAIDTARLNNKTYVGEPLLTKKGVHALDGILMCYGRLDFANRTFSICDVVPTVLDLLRLPIPNYIDGTRIESPVARQAAGWVLDIPKGL